MTPRVLLLASTFPRFRGDHCGRFLGEYVDALDLPVTVCAPHTLGAARSEAWGPVSHVHRFGAGRAELAYGAGIPDNLRARPWLAAALPAFLARWTRAAIHLARDADVIDAHWALPGGLVGAIASRVTGVPLRLVLHSGGVHVVSKLPRAQGWARRLAEQSSQITAVSSALAEQFTALSGDEVTRCPMGITPSPPQAKSAAGSVGFRGRLVPVKGVDLLVDACASLGAPLVLAGRGVPFPQTAEWPLRRLARVASRGDECGSRRRRRRRGGPARRRPTPSERHPGEARRLSCSSDCDRLTPMRSGHPGEAGRAGALGRRGSVLD
jgi:glycosyltransferase involved in cell wall biosynthesis